MTFRIEPDEGEPYEVTAQSRDVLTWEKAGKGRAFGELANRMAMVDMYGLAYFAARRQGLFTGTVQEWEQSVDLTPTDEDEDEEKEPDPTPAGPSPAPASNSPAPRASRPASGRKRATARS